MAFTTVQQQGHFLLADNANSFLHDVDFADIVKVELWKLIWPQSTNKPSLTSTEAASLKTGSHVMKYENSNSKQQHAKEQIKKYWKLLKMNHCCNKICILWTSFTWPHRVLVVQPFQVAVASAVKRFSCIRNIIFYEPSLKENGACYDVMCHSYLVISRFVGQDQDRMK